MARYGPLTRAVRATHNTDMPVPAFDTYAAVKRLREAGVEERQAEAFVTTVGDAIGEQVTKADLEPLATAAAVAELRGAMQSEIAGFRSEMANLRADVANEFKGLYRHLWVMAAGIVGVTVTLVKLIP